ncbi:MAG: DNRLRE domain-containing protein [Ilumatobacteraceae bacterium]
MSRIRLVAPVAVLVGAAVLVGGVDRSPLATAADAPIEVAVIGDFGVDTTAESNVAGLVTSWSPDYVVSTGDNFYTSGADTGTARYDRTVGKYYCPFIAGAAAGLHCSSASMSATNRFFPVTGNHDYSDGGIANYQAYFALPGAGTTSASPTGSELYYDVRTGPLHQFFIDSQGAINSSTNLTTQRTWLEAALAASDAPWKVVVFHHPPYSSSSTHGSNSLFQWPFASWGVDLVLNGHDHTYERLDIGGVTYVVNGLGGAGRYGFSTTPVAGSTVRYNANWGAMRMRVDASSLTSEFVTIGGTVVDQFTLTAGTTTVTTLQDGVSPAGYVGTADTTLSQAAPTTAFGASTTVLVDGDDPAGSGNDLVGLVRFDTSSIPAGTSVVGASIRLNVTDPSAGVYSAHEVLRTWDEATATWQQASTGVPWASAGASGAADRGAAIGTLAAPSLGTSYLTLGSAGVATVQAWIDGTRTNNGLLLAGTSVTDGVDLSSSEASTATLRPALVLVVRADAPPPPTSSTSTSTSTSTTTSTTTTTTAPPPPPGAFTKSSPVRNAKNVTKTVTLRWNASSGVTSYELCIDRDTDTICNSGWTDVGNTLSASRTLLGRSTYSWQVRAVSSAGTTFADASTWWRFTTVK